MGACVCMELPPDRECRRKRGPTAECAELNMLAHASFVELAKEELPLRAMLCNTILRCN